MAGTAPRLDEHRGVGGARARVLPDPHRAEFCATEGASAEIETL